MLHFDDMFLSNEVFSHSADFSSWDVSRATSFHSMFKQTSLIDPVVSAWDMVSATDVSGMFSKCSGCASMDVSSWDISSVTTLAEMCHGIANVPKGIETLDFSSATNLDLLLADTQAFNANVGGWDVSQVTSARGLFWNCQDFAGLGLESWSVNSLAQADWMFADSDVFNGDLNGWEVTSLTSSEFMFQNNVVFDADLSAWDTSALRSARAMFHGAQSFNRDLPTWDVSKVTDSAFMFGGAVSFESDLSGWSVGSVTDVEAMFFGASSFTSDLSQWAPSDELETCPNFWYQSQLAGPDDLPSACASTELCQVYTYVHTYIHTYVHICLLFDYEHI